MSLFGSLRIGSPGGGGLDDENSTISHKTEETEKTATVAPWIKHSSTVLDQSSGNSLYCIFCSGETDCLR